jgi:hypothetical protein
MHDSLGGVPELGTHSMALCSAGEDSQLSRRRDHEWGLWTSTTLPLDYGTTQLNKRRVLPHLPVAAAALSVAASPQDPL